MKNMASHKRIKLPPLKVTHHSQKEAREIYRGHMDADMETLGREQQAVSVHEASTDAPHTVEGSSVNEIPELYGAEDTDPTLHELHRKATANAWEKLRSNILFLATENSAMPLGQVCIVCSSAARFKCERCGPKIYYCYQCFCKQHETANFFHVAEEWENDHYTPCDIRNRRIDVRPNHICSTRRETPLKCFDEYGIQHDVLFVCCDCEDLALTLTRAKLWPASPQYPQLAYTFDLLDWAEAFLLECHVALKDFCSAIYFKCPYILSKRRDVYARLIDCFEEYRFFKHQMRHLSHLSSDLDHGNICPACPKSEGRIVYAMDALFGLPRKKAAGVSHRPAVQGHLFFVEQSCVDEHVAGSKTHTLMKNNCSNFLAGDALRSSSRYKALDETGLFGCACRHEFPVLFLDLKHGERLAYGEFILDRLIERSTESVEIYVMYDIACTLYKHLKSAGRNDMLQRITLCLPTFHCYGHSASCQMLFGPLRCEGVGLSDGETMERLWSYLRRFGRMTKEMRPAHRRDVLAHALACYGMKTKVKLAHLLVVRWERAQQMKNLSEETFANLTAQSGNIHEDQVKEWLTDERISLSVGGYGNITSNIPEWKKVYFQMLHSFYKLRDNVVSSDSSSEMQLSQLDRELKELEKKNSVLYRWNPSDKDYQELEHAYCLEKLNFFDRCLWASSVRRKFLLRLKSKYADGQKIAKKLSRQVTSETKRLRTLLEEYNICQLVVNSSSIQITLDEALDPEILSSKLHADTTSSKPHQDILEAYLQMKRSNEEIVLLESEMANTIHFYAEQRKLLLMLIEQMKQAQISEFNPFSRGAIALLHSLFRRIDKLHQECRIFPISATINIPQKLDLEGYEAATDSNSLISEYYSDSSESESDDEADY